MENLTSENEKDKSKTFNLKENLSKLRKKRVNCKLQ